MQGTRGAQIWGKGGGGTKFARVRLPPLARMGRQEESGMGRVRREEGGWVPSRFEAMEWKEGVTVCERRGEEKENARE